MIIHRTQGFVIGQAFLKHFKFNLVYKTFICTQHFRNRFSEEMSPSQSWAGGRFPNTANVKTFSLPPGSTDRHWAIQRDHRDGGRWMV